MDTEGHQEDLIQPAAGVTPAPSAISSTTLEPEGRIGGVKDTDGLCGGTTHQWASHLGDSHLCKHVVVFISITDAKLSICSLRFWSAEVAFSPRICVLELPCDILPI